MLYLTLLDQFHPGIYSSQVIDVCDHLKKRYKANIRIVAFLSVRELVRSDARKRLKALSPDALVFPSFPGLQNFELTALFLFFICLFTGQRVVICRNVFCTKMALRVKKWKLITKVVMDGRSAMAAEIGEYDVFPVDYLRKNVADFERFAVTHSDFRIAVSEELVKYWRQHYGYSEQNHVVIPCTLDTKHFSEKTFSLDHANEELRAKLGFSESDLVLVYSGSTAPWQSFELLEKILTPLLDSDKRIKVIFLSKENKDNCRLRDKYKDRIVIKWLEHKDVLPHLHCGDYGILVREQSDTNKVASPVKFAEYLYAGLDVLISENLGDFSDFVKTHACGYVLGENSANWPILQKPGLYKKEAAFKLAYEHYRKESAKNEQAYDKLMQYISPKTK
ncbi:hypothetical protein CNR22_06880 [Sphingobacteriaceae bacterium]|nr:hypothetical protein CNR22_06880 [Sphingobacteriaceae bacterium]